MDALESLFDRYLPAIDLEMRAVIEAHDTGRGDLFALLRYHLGWVDASFQPCDARSGKRLRPVLCLLTCEGCGGAWKRALPAAVATELLHNFTLIHDDIEDRDEKRRGRPTLWSLWGEAQGINAGDTLFSVSQLALLRLQERDVPDATVVRAMRLFNETCVDLTAGQCLDIDFETRGDVLVEDYLTMIEGKTAALVACSCEMGALVAGAPDAQREALRAFGRHSGLAFQIVDDLLGIWGDSAVTGKPVGADIARRKKTLPLIHGLERSAELRGIMARNVLSDADVRRTTDLLEEAGSRAFAKKLARQHHTQALAALGRAHLKHEVDVALRQLAERLLDRRR
jgi:geranylgeranyl diphosphate synthase type I